MTVSELAEKLGATVEGAGDLEITDVAEIGAAQPDQISFVYGRKAAAEVARSRAGCVLVDEEFPDPAGRTVIRAKDPRAAFALVIRLFHPAKRPAPGIHPTALIAETAKLGKNVTIGAYTTVGERSRIGDDVVIGSGCHVGDDATVGENSLIHDNVTIYSEVEVGRNAIFHSGVVIGADGFGFAMVAGHYEKFPQVGRVEIGNDVELGANSTVDRAALGVTRIGDGTKLDNLVHIGHNTTVGKHVIIVAQTGISGGCAIGDYVVIAGQVGMGDKVTIESRAVLGGQCGVLPSKTIRAGEVVWGTPARPIKEYLADLAQLRKVAGLRKEVAALRKRLGELEKA